MAKSKWEWATEVAGFLEGVAAVAIFGLAVWQWRETRQLVTDSAELVAQNRRLVADNARLADDSERTTREELAPRISIEPLPHLEGGPTSVATFGVEVRNGGKTKVWAVAGLDLTLKDGADSSGDAYKGQTWSNLELAPGEARVLRRQINPEHMRYVVNGGMPELCIRVVFWNDLEADQTVRAFEVSNAGLLRNAAGRFEMLWEWRAPSACKQIELKLPPGLTMPAESTPPGASGPWNP